MKTRIFLPYFGKFNAYFPLWLHACSYQTDFDWLILTDQEMPASLPQNIKVVYCTLQKLKKHFQKKLSLPLSLERPYKLCDYKPFYGYLLSEFLHGYDYWGYCDCDLIFGNIRKYLTQDMQGHYDKWMRTGHFSVIRNTEAVNTVFMRHETYKIILTSPVIYGYDEAMDGYHPGFAGELTGAGFSLKDLNEEIADVDFRHYPFYEVGHTGGPWIYLYDAGNLYRIRRHDGEVMKEECMYVHLQKRRMIVENITDPDHFLICPNHLMPCPDTITGQNRVLYEKTLWMQASREKKGYFNPYKEKYQSVYRDFRRLMHEPRKADSLLYRIKRGHREYEKNIHCGR